MSGAKENWRIEGEYFESCNCEMLCPCLLSGSQARPTDGHCDVVLAFHVNRGSYGKTDISGLNAVQALTTPGPMAKGGGTLALYIDSKANAEQRAALEAIFDGSAGGPPALFGPMIATRLPTKSAPITFTANGNVKKLSIPSITEVTVEGVTGAGNKVVWIDNVGHPASTRLAIAKGTSSSFKDHNLVFENSGRNGHFAPINWSNA
ncbi:MAG: DUF1326 domain-containing protein [Candidatus Binatus sp.]|uniref:DUF1326 domain-containing protein n=1 Tax=Candidatus Binatus sp. TaxID=2811406 RepID=UPI002716D720|nr:DUF1326 domain-containing protein [Candidatus Binatus sp.]MDO8432799.1 DUF1326 domain-containing protein [Candidatus Binatus sp.]